MRTIRVYVDTHLKMRKAGEMMPVATVSKAALNALESLRFVHEVCPAKPHATQSGLNQVCEIG